MNGPHLSVSDPVSDAAVSTSHCGPLVEHHAAIFRSWPTAALVMNPDLVLCDANPAYLAVTNRRLEDLVGRHLFDAFPLSSMGQDGDDGQWLRRSLQRVLTTHEPDHVPVQRYDMPWDGAPGGFVERYWAPSNSPILDDDGELIGILNVVEDVTGFQDDLQAALDFYQAEIRSQGESWEASNVRFAEYVRASATAARTYASIAEEVEQLRAALTSRAVIDQAKGIVMAMNDCHADEAFELLVHRSQIRNVKLRDVAQDLVDLVGRELADDLELPGSADDEPDPN